MSEEQGGARRIVATQEYVGRSCPYCRFPIKEGGTLAVCGQCHSAHHAECWSDNAGCAIVGCAAAPTRVSQAAAESTFAKASMRPPLSVEAEQWPRAAVPQAPPPPPSPPQESRHGNRALVLAVAALAVAVAGGAIALLAGKGSQGRSEPTVSVKQAAASRPATTTKTILASASPTASSPTVPAQESATGSGSAVDGSSTSTSQDDSLTDTTSSDSSSATSPVAQDATAGSSDSPAADALKAYWKDIDRGDFSDARMLQTSGPSTNYMTAKPMINIVSVGQPTPDGDAQDVPITFWAQDTVDTAPSDTICRFIVLNARMVPSGNGGWLYAGTASHGNHKRDEPGNSNCHS